MSLKLNFIILFIISNVLANEILSIRSYHDTKVELEMPIEIINNYLLKYFSSKKVFLSFFMEASDQIEHEKQTEIVDRLYIKSVYTHFSHMKVDFEENLTLRDRLPFLLLFVDGVSSFM